MPQASAVESTNWQHRHTPPAARRSGSSVSPAPKSSSDASPLASRPHGTATFGNSPPPKTTTGPTASRRRTSPQAAGLGGSAAHTATATSTTAASGRYGAGAGESHAAGRSFGDGGRPSRSGASAASPIGSRVPGVTSPLSGAGSRPAQGTFGSGLYSDPRPEAARPAAGVSGSRPLSGTGAQTFGFGGHSQSPAHQGRAFQSQGQGQGRATQSNFSDPSATVFNASAVPGTSSASAGPYSSTRLKRSPPSGLDDVSNSRDFSAPRAVPREPLPDEGGSSVGFEELSPKFSSLDELSPKMSTFEPGLRSPLEPIVPPSLRTATTTAAASASSAKGHDARFHAPDLGAPSGVGGVEPHGVRIGDTFPREASAASAGRSSKSPSTGRPSHSASAGGVHTPGAGARVTSGGKKKGTAESVDDLLNASSPRTGRHGTAAHAAISGGSSAERLAQLRKRLEQYNIAIAEAIGQPSPTAEKPAPADRKDENDTNEKAPTAEGHGAAPVAEKHSEPLLHRVSGDLTIEEETASLDHLARQHAPPGAPALSSSKKTSASGRKVVGNDDEESPPIRPENIHTTDDEFDAMSNEWPSGRSVRSVLRDDIPTAGAEGSVPPGDALPPPPPPPAPPAADETSSAATRTKDAESSPPRGAAHHHRQHYGHGHGHGGSGHGGAVDGSSSERRRRHPRKKKGTTPEQRPSPSKSGSAKGVAHETKGGVPAKVPEGKPTDSDVDFVASLLSEFQGVGSGVPAAAAQGGYDFDGDDGGGVPAAAMAGRAEEDFDDCTNGADSEVHVDVVEEEITNHHDHQPSHITESQQQQNHHFDDEGSHDDGLGENTGTQASHDDEDGDIDPNELDDDALHELCLQSRLVRHTADQIRQTHTQIGPSLFSALGEACDYASALRSERVQLQQQESVLHSRGEESKYKRDEIIAKSDELCLKMADLHALCESAEPYFVPLDHAQARLEAKRSVVEQKRIELEEKLRALERRRAYLAAIEGHNHSRQKVVARREEAIANKREAARPIEDETQKKVTEADRREEKVAEWLDLLKRKQSDTDEAEATLVQQAGELRARATAVSDSKERLFKAQQEELMREHYGQKNAASPTSFNAAAQNDARQFPNGSSVKARVFGGGAGTRQESLTPRGGRTKRSPQKPLKEELGVMDTDDDGDGDGDHDADLEHTNSDDDDVEVEALEVEPGADEPRVMYHHRNSNRNRPAEEEVHVVEVSADFAVDAHATTAHASSAPVPELAPRFGAPPPMPPPWVRSSAAVAAGLAVEEREDLDGSDDGSDDDLRPPPADGPSHAPTTKIPVGQDAAATVQDALDPRPAATGSAEALHYGHDDEPDAEHGGLHHGDDAYDTSDDADHGEDDAGNFGREGEFYDRFGNEQVPGSVHVLRPRRLFAMEDEEDATSGAGGAGGVAAAGGGSQEEALAKGRASASVEEMAAAAAPAVFNLERQRVDPPISAPPPPMPETSNRRRTSRPHQESPRRAPRPSSIPPPPSPPQAAAPAPAPAPRSTPPPPPPPSSEKKRAEGPDDVAAAGPEAVGSAVAGRNGESIRVAADTGSVR